MEKMTNKKALEFVLNNCTLPVEVSDKLNNMLASLDKKRSSTSRKQVEKRKVDDGFKAIIIEVLSGSNDYMTATDIMRSSETLSDLTSQKVVSLITQMLKDGTLEKEVRKNRAYFGLAE